MKLLFFVFTACICYNSAYSQSSKYTPEHCNDPFLVAQIDSIDIFRKDEELIGALENLTKIIIQLEKNKMIQCETYFKALLLEAQAHRADFDFEKSLALCHNLIIKLKKTSFYEIQALTYIELELIHEFLDNWDECHKNIVKARELIAERQLESVKPLYFVRLSSLTRFTGTTEDAIQYAQESVKLAILQEDRASELGGYMMISFLIENKRKKIEYLQKAARIYEDFDDIVGQAFMYIAMAEAATLQTKEGRMYLNQAADLLPRFSKQDENYYDLQKAIYSLQSENFEEENQIDSAFYYAKLAFAAEKAGIYDQDREEIALEAIKFELFQTKDELSDIQRESIWFRRFFTAGIVSLAILSFLVGLIYKNRQKLILQSREIKNKNLALQTYNEKNELLLSEVHHRVKNSLQNIIGLIHLKQVKAQPKENDRELADLAAKIYSMSLMHETLYTQGEFDAVEMQKYIENLINNFRQITSDARNVQFDLAIEKTTLNLETSMPVGLIITELITNSLKHNSDSKNLKIKIGLYSEKNLIKLKYEDNGIGIIPGNNSSEGTGLSLVRGLVRQLQGVLKIENIKGFQASFSFSEKVVSKI